MPAVVSVVRGGGAGEGAEDLVDLFESGIAVSAGNSVDDLADGVGVVGACGAVGDRLCGDGQDRIESRAGGSGAGCEEAGVLDAAVGVGAGESEEFDEVFLRCGEFHGVVDAAVLDFADESIAEPSSFRRAVSAV